MQDFKRLNIYNDSKEFVVDMYEVLGNFPPTERYGLSDQLRRASISVPSNISEGTGQPTNKAFAKYLHHSLGSCKEIECQLDLAQTLGFISKNDYERLDSKIVSIAKQISSLIKRINEGENK